MVQSTTAIIQARMGSTRLPGKVMKQIGGMPILWYVLERIKQAKSVSDIILVTTDNKCDDEIVTFCHANNLKFYRGSENDVLDRYYQATKYYDIKGTIVRLTSDCPLIDPSIIDSLVNKYISESQYSHYYLRNTDRNDPRTYPSGFDVEVFDATLLELNWLNEKDLSKREHVMSFIDESLCSKQVVTMNTEMCDIRESIERFMNEGNDLDRKILHLSVDTPEDFTIIKKILEYFLNKEIGLLFRFKDVLNIQLFTIHQCN